MNVLGEKLGGIGLRFPNLEDAPPIAGWPSALRNEPSCLFESWAQGSDHAVISFQRLAGNVCCHKYSHVSILQFLISVGQFARGADRATWRDYARRIAR